MSERLASISMQAFRGISHSFTLELDGGKSCVVLGDNGTGKSSVADAVEWYFSGNIGLLSREGRHGAIRHTGAPPDLKTRVAICTDGSLGGAISTASSPSPNVREVGQSEMFLLRGRALADFVDKTKGEKWQAFGELLGLETIDRLRLDLQWVRNKLEERWLESASECSAKESALREYAPDTSDRAVLSELRKKCIEAKISVPATLDQALDPTWIKTIARDESIDRRASELQNAMADLRALGQQTISLDPIDSWNSTVCTNKQEVRPWQLFKAAQELLNAGDSERDHCPLCGQTVDHALLAEKIIDTIRAFEAAELEIADIRQALRLVVTGLQDGERMRTGIAQRARGLGINFADPIEFPGSEFDERIDSFKSIEFQDIEGFLRLEVAWDNDALEALAKAMPEPVTARDQLLVNIVVLHIRAREFRSTKIRSGKCKRDFASAEQIFAKYQAKQLEYFDAILRRISNHAADIYSYLHAECGLGEVAVEIVGDKGVELSVEFFGNKESPPHRVLSESHLSSLGLALFLAMADTFNDQIGFIVLDDVVSSFDRDHRGRLAKLLVEKSRRSQMIVLTHDEQFFTQVARGGPDWIRGEFLSWTYEFGPRLKRIAGDRLLDDSLTVLSRNDRIGAAQKGRRYLEEFLQEACEALEALLPFKRGSLNNRRPVEEVLRGLRRTLKRKARTMYSDVSPLLQSLEVDLQATLNFEVHASQSAASDQEVRDALAHIVSLRSLFTCEVCKTRVWHKGTPESSRCHCGSAQFPPV